MYEYYVAGANMEPACSVRYPLVRFANLPACSVRELSIDPLRANNNNNNDDYRYVRLGTNVAA